MTDLPIPFFTAFLLVLLALSSRPQLTGTETGRLFLAFLYVNAVSMVCIGLRWSLDQVMFLPLAAVLAVLGSAMLYLAFRSLGTEGPVVELHRDWPHLLPACLLVLAIFIGPQSIDALLIIIKVAYAVLIARLAKRSPTSLELVPLHWFSNSQKALWVTTAVLGVSVAIDVVVAIDFALYDGQHAARLVGVANLVVIVLLGWASVLAGRGSFKPAVTDPVTTTAEQVVIKPPSAVNGDQPIYGETNALFDQLNRLLVDEQLFTDSGLNLQKLARKAGVPSRAVSRAINTHSGMNVSQWINRIRIDAVCESLVSSETSITHAMHDAGFLTKSNFNREFRRAKGCSPSEWRAGRSQSDQTNIG